MLIQSFAQEDPLEEEMATQYSCLENPTDREARRAMVHGVAKSQTGLKGLNPQAYMKTVPNYCPFPPIG